MSTRAARNPRILASPLRYPGGKGVLYGRLRKLIRDNDLAGCTYVEPFAGGAGAGLNLLVTGQVDKVVINDLNPAIYSFWTLVQNDPAQLASRIKSASLDIAEWRKQKEVYASADSSSIEDLGFATFYLNRTNRSGILNGGPIGGLAQKGKDLIDARFNREELAERVRTLSLYSSKIEVSCLDGAAVVEAHGKRSGTFIYADPPYFEKAGSLYMNSFKMVDHESLADTLNGLSEGSWILTYDSVPDVARLYPDRRRRRFNINYSANKIVKATETLVLSDALADVEEGWPM